MDKKFGILVEFESFISLFSIGWVKKKYFYTYNHVEYAGEVREAVATASAEEGNA
jgi:hypothetical protein